MVQGDSKPIEYVEDCFSQDDPKAFYNKTADSYDHHLKQAMQIRYKHTLDVCLKHFKKEHKILDVGAGTGGMAELLRDQGYTELHALDASVNMLAEARKKNLYKDYIIELVDPSIASRVKDNEFDGIVTVGTIGPGHMNPDHFTALIRMVRKGGVVVIGMNKTWLLPHKGDVYNEWNFNMIRRLKEMEDLNQLKVISNDIVPDSKESSMDGAYLAIEVL